MDENENREDAVPALIPLLQDQYEATTETDGTYRIEEVSPGEYLFTIVAPGYVPRRGFLAVTVISDGDHYVDLKITRKGFLKKFSFAWPCVLSWSLLSYLIGLTIGVKRKKIG